MHMMILQLPQRNESGQVAVAILLILTVMLTIAVSTAVRTTEEVSLSTQQNEATRVFNAAEAGIDLALKDGDFVDPAGSFGSYRVTGTATVQWSVTPSSDYNDTVEEGKGVTINLENNTSNVSVYWSSVEDSPEARASLLIAVYYDNAEDSVEYFAVGPSTRGDDFVTPAGGGPNYNFKFDVPFGSVNPVAMRVIPVYEDTDLEVTGTNLPIQQHLIRSEAINEVQNANFEKKVIEVTRTQPAPPVFMDYALYAKGGIIKN